MNLSRVQRLRVGTGDVQVGAARMTAAGEAVSITPYADGEAGIQQSLALICSKIREGRVDTAVRGWAGDVLMAAGSPSTARGKAQAILSAVWSATVYAPDPAGAEFIQSAAATLCLRPGLCIRAADCDDLVVVTGSALLSINVPCVVVRQQYGDGIQQHVLLAAQDEAGDWFYVDPTARNKPMGWAAPNATEDYYDPLNGVTTAVLVGVGATPDDIPVRERSMLKRADGKWWEGVRVMDTDGNETERWFRYESAGVGWVPAAFDSLHSALSIIAPTPHTLGDVPAGSWVPTDFPLVKAGQRYWVSAVVSKPNPADALASDWQTDNVDFTQGDARIGFAPAWRFVAVATHDAPKDNADVTYLAVFEQVAQTVVAGQPPTGPVTQTPASGPLAPLPPSGQLAPPDLTNITPASGVSLGSVALGGGVVAGIVGIVWGLRRWRATRRRGRK